MNRGGRASEVVDLIDLEEEWFDDVVADQLEPRVSEMVHNVLLAPREEVVDDDHAIPSRDQAVHEVAPDEPRPTGDHDPKTLPLQP